MDPLDNLYNAGLFDATGDFAQCGEIRVAYLLRYLHGEYHSIIAGYHVRGFRVLWVDGRWRFC